MTIDKNSYPGLEQHSKDFIADVRKLAELQPSGVTEAQKAEFVAVSDFVAAGEYKLAIDAAAGMVKDMHFERS